LPEVEWLIEHKGASWIGRETLLKLRQLLLEEK